MNAIEFTTELSGAGSIEMPAEIARQLPKAGKARVIVLTDDGTDEAEWRIAAGEQFLRDDSAEDAIYDSLCRPPPGLGAPYFERRARWTRATSPM